MYSRAAYLTAKDLFSWNYKPSDLVLARLHIV